MTQPAVALSDFALAIEAGIFTWLIYRNREARRRVARGDSSRNDSGTGPLHTLRRWFVRFFCAAAAASLIGGTVHGFFLSPTTFAARALWPATMIAVGAAAWAAWGIGSELALSPAGARTFAWLATTEFVVYAVAVVLGLRSFRAAIINYLPAAIFLLAAFAITYARRRDASYLLGALAMVVTLLAAVLQQSKIAIAPLGLTHNVIYHLVQGLGLLLLFLSARHLTTRR